MLCLLLFISTHSDAPKAAQPEVIPLLSLRRDLKRNEVPPFAENGCLAYYCGISGKPTLIELPNNVTIKMSDYTFGDNFLTWTGKTRVLNGVNITDQVQLHFNPEQLGVSGFITYNCKRYIVFASGQSKQLVLEMK